VTSAVDFERIYSEHADEYDRLVAAEDCEHRLLPAIESIAPLADARVLEVGAGTGRVSRLLLTRGVRLIAIDRSEAMLAVARRHLAAFPRERWELHAGDARRLPVADGWAHVAIAGWAFGHLRFDHPASWREDVARAIGEMDRALEPQGVLILIETLGTGAERAGAPSPELGEYFDWLERDQSMRREVIRTDFEFPDPETAARTMEFFFGRELSSTIRARGWSRVPEWTGLWWRSARSVARETGAGRG
jgi:ubiquinone/menaquinone biosynthesis C-methylase UbiE